MLSNMFDYKTWYVYVGYSELADGSGVYAINEQIRLRSEEGWEFFQLTTVGDTRSVYVTFRREAPSRGLKTASNA